MRSYYLNQCWSIVNSTVTLRKKTSMKCLSKYKCFFHENVSENIAWVMEAIFSVSQHVAHSQIFLDNLVDIFVGDSLTSCCKTNTFTHISHPSIEKWYKYSFTSSDVIFTRLGPHAECIPGHKFLRVTWAAIEENVALWVHTNVCTYIYTQTLTYVPCIYSQFILLK